MNSIVSFLKFFFKRPFGGMILLLVNTFIGYIFNLVKDIIFRDVLLKMQPDVSIVYKCVKITFKLNLPYILIN